MPIMQPPASANTGRTFCKCGCGTEIMPWCDWSVGHYVRTEVTLQRMSESGMEHEVSDETRQTMSEARQRAFENDPTLGDRLSEAIREAYEGDPTTMDERSEAYCGEGNPNWQGGVSRYGGLWNAVRPFILLRDNHTCQGCGSIENLDVHHIDEDPLNGDERNLITACRKCNCSASKEGGSRLRSIFKRRIREIYLEKE